MQLLDEEKKQARAIYEDGPAAALRIEYWRDADKGPLYTSRSASSPDDASNVPLTTAEGINNPIHEVYSSFITPQVSRSKYLQVISADIITTSSPRSTLPFSLFNHCTTSTNSSKFSFATADACDSTIDSGNRVER